MRHARAAALPLLLLAFGAAAAGCSGTPGPNAALDQARASYRSAVSDPDVARNAPAELQRSRKALAAAERVWREEEDSEHVAHLAYLARQRAATAREVARYEQAQQAIADASEEHRQALLDVRAREAEIARRRAEITEQLFRELQARQTERGIVLTLGDVLFNVDEASLKPGAMPTIRRLAEFLEANPARTILIEGFTDSTGGEDYNLVLSEQRAAAVRAALLDQGIGGDRIRIQGYGEAMPVASNETTAGRQLNRRVEVVVSGADGRIAGRAS